MKPKYVYMDFENEWLGAGTNDCAFYAGTINWSHFYYVLDELRVGARDNIHYGRQHVVVPFEFFGVQEDTP
jgi:hypothetical protein